VKLIDVLIRLYPREFRARFGRDMRDFHEQRVRERRAAWPRIVADHVASAAVEQARAVRPNVAWALRTMARRPGLTTVVVLTIALGVGANAAIFSVVNGILLRPLPWADADRLLVLTHAPPQWLVSEPQFATYRHELRSFESLAAYTSSEATLETAEDPERLTSALVTTNYFATLGVRPALGRTFTAGEALQRPPAVVMLGYETWQRRFNGDPRVVGRRVVVSGVPRTVVGVLPERFDHPSRDTQLWFPICSLTGCKAVGELPADTLEWANHYLFLVGRLRAGVSEASARREASALAARITRDHPGNFDASTPLVARIVSVRDQLVGTTRPYLVALLGSVGVVLLIVCANVANLLLARGEGRRREMAVRAALGASRARLVTQLLTEAAVLAIAGGALGLAFAWWGTRGLLSLAPASLPRADAIRLDWPVVAFCFAVSLAAGLLFGMVPALRAAREAPGESLKASGKGVAARGSTGRTRRTLVIAELALAMVLLSGAGMLLRSLLYLHDQDMGFRPEGVLTANVSLSAAAFDDARTVQYYEQLMTRVRAIPGVTSAGAARWLPVVDQGGTWDIAVEGKTYAPAQAPGATPQEITPGYLDAMGLRLVAGRDFTAEDRAGAPLVAIVSQSFARRIWPGDDPLGRRFRLGGRDTTWVRVVGVVRDIRARGFTDTPEPTMYFPHAQVPQSGYFVPRSMSLVVRTSVAPLAVANPVRAAVRAMGAGVPVSKVQTLEAVVAVSTANRRFSTALIAGFATLALVLAGIGTFGVIAYSVSERTFEIGVRMALGADRGRILALVVGEGARMAAVGIAAGVLGSALLAHAIRTLLVGLPLVDPATMLAVGALLATVALSAALMAARRAVRVQPTEALRGG
jgi:putative ABC transport system permease protein